MENEVKQQEQIKLPQDFQALIAGFFPTTKYFDSRFDLLQVQIDESRRNQEQIKEQLKDFKGDNDKRFEQVDRRFEDAKEQFKDFKGDNNRRFEDAKEQLKDFKDDNDKRFEQMDHRFQRFEGKMDTLIEHIDVKVDGGLKENRNLTVRLFTFALSFSLVAVIGMFGKLFGLF